MIRAILILFFAVMAAAAPAQEPRVTVELADPEVIVGQPAALTITVLVPTWMPKAPVFPSFEVPSLMVRLPEGATTSISERIGRDTWAGLRRTYRLYPLAEGMFVLPAQTIGLTYADPETRQPVTAEVPTPEIRLIAVVPEAARGLDPLIVATGFTLDQTVEGPVTLVAGDAVVREVRAEIAGTTPLLIPELIPPVEGAALRAYPSEPSVGESEDRAGLSGSRTEKVTYVAQGDGAAVLPQVSLDWFNLETGAVETATLPATALTVTGGPSAAADGGLPVRAIVGILALVGAAAVAVRLFLPRLLRWRASLRDRWLASEAWAHRQVLSAIAARDLGAVFAALDIWTARSAPDAEDKAQLSQALAALGRAKHGATPGTADWSGLRADYVRCRRKARRNRRPGKADTLPPLNPKANA